MFTFLADLNPVALTILVNLLSAIFGAVISGYFVQRYWSSRVGESTLIDGLRIAVDLLQDKTVDYWSLDCRGESKKNEEDRQQARTLETKIKADILKLYSSLRGYSARYCKREDFTQLMAEVADACTNGEFEQKRRSPDKDRYKLVNNAASRLKATLLKRRV